MLLKLNFLHLFKILERTSNLQRIFPHNKTELFNEIPGHAFYLKNHKLFACHGTIQQDGFNMNFSVIVLSDR